MISVTICAGKLISKLGFSSHVIIADIVLKIKYAMTKDENEFKKKLPELLKLERLSDEIP
jgi:hypothetical protein